MKYIRTEDGRIFEIEDFTDIKAFTDIKEYNKFMTEGTIYEYDSEEVVIVKQADTIEELCDVFEVDSIYSGVLPDLYYYFNKEKLLKELNKPWVKGVYGCIYEQIDDFNAKHIPVCKLNKEGELKLI